MESSLGRTSQDRRNLRDCIKERRTKQEKDGGFKKRGRVDLSSLERTRCKTRGRESKKEKEKR